MSLGYEYDYKYDWVMPRVQRLDAVLRTNSSTTIEISLNSLDLKEMRNKRSDRIDLLQPLPIYSLISDTALYVRMSRRSSKMLEQPKEEKSFCKEQSIFLLNPNKINYRPGKIELEFIDRATH